MTKITVSKAKAKAVARAKTKNKGGKSIWWIEEESEDRRKEV
jgi:hypothetical protein